VAGGCVMMMMMMIRDVHVKWVAAEEFFMSVNRCWKRVQ
jgi:hypothetical protein